MHTIYHQVGVRTSLEEVYRSLSNSAGIAGWWSSFVDGTPEQEGASFGLGFGNARMEMRVVTLDKPTKVVWQCIRGHSLWGKTLLEFQLSYDADNEQTIVAFFHKGWSENGPLFRHCSTKWAVFMLSLKELLENGVGKPYPKDVPVNHY